MNSSAAESNGGRDPAATWPIAAPVIVQQMVAAPRPSRCGIRSRAGSGGSRRVPSIQIVTAMQCAGKEMNWPKTAGVTKVRYQRDGHGQKSDRRQRDRERCGGERRPARQLIDKQDLRWKRIDAGREKNRMPKREAEVARECTVAQRTPQQHEAGRGDSNGEATHESCAGCRIWSPTRGRSGRQPAAYRSARSWRGWPTVERLFGGLQSLVI